MNILNNLLRIIPKENILENEPMKNHTSFKIGGNASYVVMPRSTEEIKELITYFKKDNIPYFVMGNGSNLLVTDKGYSGVIIKMTKFAGITLNGDKVNVLSGTLMSKLSNFLKENSLDGFSELSGIPGTIGGAVYMNAGAYGKEIKDIILSVTVLNEKGETEKIEKDNLDLSYRHSVFTDRNAVILSAEFEFEKGNADEIREKIKEVTKKRVGKQPLNYPSAGSTFKRPEGFFAAKIIEDCGFKGKGVGGCKVSEKHSGFVINYNNATFSDVMELTDEIKKKAKEKFGVDLELEVKILGE